MRHSIDGRFLLRARSVSAWCGGALAVVVAVILAPADAGSVRTGTAAANASATFPVGWTKLPRPPEVRHGAAFVWTGSAVIAWGGCARPADDACRPTAAGFAFDPVRRRWEPIPDAPLPATSAEAIWTGAEAIFLHPVDGRLGGQAYDPKSGRWRALANAPIAPREGGIRAWTGSELIVWGGGRPTHSSATNGAAYDPARDAWRPMAQAPLGLNLASGMWTGRELVVLGSLLDHRNVAATRTAVGAAYDPATNSWRELSPSRLSPQATSAVWLNGRIVAWDYEVRSQTYDPARERWTAPIRMPFGFSECYPDSVGVRGLVFAFFCGRVALYDTATRRWREIRGGPLDAEIEAGSGASYKLWQSASLVPAGDVVFLAMERVSTAGRRGEICSGCAGSRVSYWAYRPPPARELRPAPAVTSSRTCPCPG